MNAARKRYAAIALEKNMRLAAERIAERKPAEQQAQTETTAKKPPASVPADVNECFAAKEATTA